MQRQRIRPGIIIRRKSEYGVPIGPHMVVSMTTSKYVVAVPLGMKNADVQIGREHVYIPKAMTIRIPKDRVLSMRAGICTVISHPPTAAWVKALDEVPEIIHFWAPDGSIKATVTVDYVEEKIVLREKVIKIFINRVLL